MLTIPVICLRDHPRMPKRLLARLAANGRRVRRVRREPVRRRKGGVRDPALHCGRYERQRIRSARTSDGEVKQRLLRGAAALTVFPRRRAQHLPERGRVGAHTCAARQDGGRPVFFLLFFVLLVGFASFFLGLG